MLRIAPEKTVSCLNVLEVLKLSEFVMDFDPTELEREYWNLFVRCILLNGDYVALCTVAGLL